MKRIDSQKGRELRGFTLIELILVIAVVGVVIAIVVPRAWRARTDAKFNMVRQVGAEVGKWAVTWAERNQEIQPETVECVLRHYLDSLAGNWTAQPNTNWLTPTLVGCDGGTSLTPNASVDGIVNNISLQNPFNGKSYFDSNGNYPGAGGTNLEPGMMYLGSGTDNEGGAVDYQGYYLVFLGLNPTGVTDWYGSMENYNPGSTTGESLGALKAGVFVIRLAP